MIPLGPLLPTAGAGAQLVALADIIRDPDLQVRQQTDPKLVREYAAILKNGNTEFPPVILARVDGGALYLVDGWHRVGAHAAQGRSTISATIVDTANLREARWMAAQANLRQGQRLASRDALNVFRAYIGARKHRKKGGGFKGLRVIAAELGGSRSYTTIRNWLKKHYPSVWREMTTAGAEDAPEGRPVKPEASPEDAAEQRVREALEEAVAAMRGVRDADRRGALVAFAEGTVGRLKAVGPWTPATLWESWEPGGSDF